MNFYLGLSSVLGLGVQPKELSFLQVALRGLIVFVAALLMIRLADRRFLSRLSPFDALLGFLLASMLARAVNGSAPFFPTLGVGFLLVILHRILATLAFYSHRVGLLIKGRPQVLVQEGLPDPRAMRAHKITTEDILEEARLNGLVTELPKIQTATIERNGQVSVIPSSKAA